MKMKYFFILLIIFFIFILFGCTVNGSTGLIKIENQTTVELKNVRVGETLIALSVSPGSDYYYWYFDTMSGEVNSDNIDTFAGFDGKWEFKVGYWVTISATLLETKDGKEPYITVEEEKNGP